MSDTTIDDILDEYIPHHAKLENGDALIIYPKTRKKVKQLTKSALYDLIDKKILEARISESAWAYKNMRDHGTDKAWVEVAKMRHERLKSNQSKG